MSTHRFYKEKGIWYIDLPEFLEQGLGTKANLMMVAGADTLLDKLSDNGDQVTVAFSEKFFEDAENCLIKTGLGHDEDYLNQVGHAPVDGGAYYTTELGAHDLWLCPVTKYVFGGHYPESIWIQTEPKEDIDPTGINDWLYQ